MLISKRFNSQYYFAINLNNVRISFNKLLLQKEELEQRHLHLLQVVESEMTAKWQYTQQCEELATEIKKLRAEVINYKQIISRSLNNDVSNENHCVLLTIVLHKPLFIHKSLTLFKKYQKTKFCFKHLCISCVEY